MRVLHHVIKAFLCGAHDYLLDIAGNGALARGDELEGGVLTKARWAANVRPCEQAGR